MSSPTPRRPRFLASLPETPELAPLRLAPAPGGAAASAPPRPLPRPEPPPAIRGEEVVPRLSPPEATTDGRAEAVARVGAAIEALRAQAAHLGEQARGDALEIGFAVARAILATELRQNPEALFSLVRSAVRRAGDSRRIVVRVAPEDLPLLRGAAGAALDGASAARVELEADPALARGDCVVDADFGRVDGRLATRLAELRRAACECEEVG